MCACVVRRGQAEVQREAANKTEAMTNKVKLMDSKFQLIQHEYNALKEARLGLMVRHQHGQNESSVAP